MDMTFIERMRSMNQEITKIRRKLMTELDRERYEHTLGVMYTAASMAMCHGTDTEQALLAGLLHDCAKCIPGESKIKLCEKYHLNISEVERANPSLLHAKLGAFLAAKKYHVEDKAIINAIASHTRCLYRILEDSLVYLKSQGKPVDPMTEKTYDYYKIKLEKQ